MTALLVTVGELLIYTQLAAKIVPLQSGVSLTHVPFHVPTLTTQILANVISVYVMPQPSRPGLSFRLSSHFQLIRIPTYSHTQYQHYLHAANTHLVPEHKLIFHTGICLQPAYTHHILSDHENRFHEYCIPDRYVCWRFSTMNTLLVLKG